jgi:glycerol-3-phosphate dehydrogenase (NAD(P)+)
MRHYRGRLLRDWTCVSDLARLQGREGCCDIGRRNFRPYAGSGVDYGIGLACSFSSQPLCIACLSIGGDCNAYCDRGDVTFRATARTGPFLFFARPGNTRHRPTSLKFFSSPHGYRATFHTKVKLEKTAILGAGGWGTALSILWATEDGEILLWGHNPARVARLRETRENSDYLPGVKLAESVGLTTDLKDCAAADLIVFVTPSRALREIAGRVRDVLDNDYAVLLTCTKGIEHSSGKRMSEILREIFPHHPIAVLSGPNLATEVARGLPTATVLACSDTQQSANLQAYLGRPRFRIYTGDELAGIELGGALKNVFAIAAGASDGLGLGENSKAALVTRALAEMIRLGTAMGGKLSTFYGLSGAGDLTLTCFSRASRNRHVGELLGRGRSLPEITSAMQMVAEGIPTAKSAYECARKLKIDTPIIDQVYALLYEERTAARAMQELLGRDQKAEWR